MLFCIQYLPIYPSIDCTAPHCIASHRSVRSSLHIPLIPLLLLPLILDDCSHPFSSIECSKTIFSSAWFHWSSSLHKYMVLNRWSLQVWARSRAHFSSLSIFPFCCCLLLAVFASFVAAAALMFCWILKVLSRLAQYCWIGMVSFSGWSWSHYEQRTKNVATSSLQHCWVGLKMMIFFILNKSGVRFLSQPSIEPICASAILLPLYRKDTCIFSTKRHTRNGRKIIFRFFLLLFVRLLAILFRFFICTIVRL